MSETEIIAVFREAVVVALVIAAPALIIGLAVGLVVSLFQALTQIQEMTLAFVPKIVAIFLSLIVFIPWMLAELVDFTRQLADRAIGLG